MPYISCCPLYIQFADQTQQSEPTTTLQPEEKQEKRAPTPHPNANKSVAVPQVPQVPRVSQWQTLTGVNGVCYATDPATMIRMSPELAHVFGKWEITNMGQLNAAARYGFGMKKDNGDPDTRDEYQQFIDSLMKEVK